MCRITRTCKAGLQLLAHKHEGYWHPQVAPFCWLADRCHDGKGWIHVQHWNKVLCFVQNAKELRSLIDHLFIEDVE